MPDIIGDVDELLTTVRHIARSDVHKIHEDADNEAERIREEAEEKAEQVRNQILDEARKKARDIRRRRREQAGHEQKEEYLQAREEALDKVWNDAEQKLRDITGQRKKYTEALHQLVLAAVDSLGPGEWVLASDKNGMDALTDKRLEKWAEEAAARVGDKVTFERASHSADIWGGVVVSSKDGSCRADASFAERLRTAQEEIRKQVLNQLVTT